MRYLDLSGNRYGKLTVAYRSSNSGKNGEVIFVCECDCGKVSEVFASNLRSGYTTSCGCLRNETTSRRMSEQSWGRSHYFNERFFENIDTERSAYWLGFLGADGNIYKNSVQLALGAKDVGHLYKFMEDIGLDTVPVYRKENNTYLLRVNSKAMVTDLKGLGMTTKKSLTYLPPELAILNDNIVSYWRGMVDGDGWISKKAGDQKAVGLCGTHETIISFLEFIRGRGVPTNCAPYKRSATVNHWSVDLGGNKQAPQICKILYENALIYLDRKYGRAMEFIYG